jgi:hypothetical protein
MKLLWIAGSLALSACAADCGGDWYQLGQRDGRLGASSQVEYYGARCNAQPDAERYAEGYRAGFAQRPVPNW